MEGDIKLLPFKRSIKIILPLDIEIGPLTKKTSITDQSVKGDFRVPRQSCYYCYLGLYKVH